MGLESCICKVAHFHKSLFLISKKLYVLTYLLATLIVYQKGKIPSLLLLLIKKEKYVDDHNLEFDYFLVLINLELVVQTRDSKDINRSRMS